MLALTYGPPFHSSMIFFPFGVMIPWGVIPSLAAGKVFLTVRVRVRSNERLAFLTLSRFSFFYFYSLDESLHRGHVRPGHHSYSRRIYATLDRSTLAARFPNPSTGVGGEDFGREGELIEGFSGERGQVDVELDPGIH